MFVRKMSRKVFDIMGVEILSYQNNSPITDWHQGSWISEYEVEIQKNCKFVPINNMFTLCYIRILSLFRMFNKCLRLL